MQVFYLFPGSVLNVGQRPSEVLDGLGEKIARFEHLETVQAMMLKKISGSKQPLSRV